MRKIILILLLLSFVSFNSCEETNKPQIVFSICNFEDDNPMTEAIVEGCQRAINEHEISKDYDIILDHQIYPNDTATFGNEFLKLGNSANLNLIKGIMVKGMNTLRVKNIIDQVALSGNIIFTFENDMWQSLRYSYFGPNYNEIGRIVANICSSLGDEIDKVVIVTSNSNFYYESEAVNGFEGNYAYEHPNTQIANLLIKWNKKNIQESIESLAEDKDLDFIFIVQTNLFEYNLTLPYEFKNKFVVTIGGFPNQYDDLKDGKIDKIIAYNPFELGKLMMKSMIDLSLFNIEPKNYNFIDFNVIDSSNADEWYKIWE